MTIGAVLVGLALLALIVSIVLRPLAQRGRRDEAAPQEQAPPRLEAVLAALRDLDFDHQTGKVAQEDYTPARAGLLAKAAQAMERGPQSSVEEILEARVKEIRRRLDEAEPATYCSGCGGRVLRGDRFCPRCGLTQAVACPSCGRTVRPDDHYCVECGCRLPMEATPNQ
jgi:hypothetical protein